MAHAPNRSTSQDNPQNEMAAAAVAIPLSPSPAQLGAEDSSEVHVQVSSPQGSIAVDARRHEQPPRWLNSLMLFVYPGSLGLDEAINGSCLKAGISMMNRCAQGEGSCTHPLLYIALVVIVLSALATVWWLRVVFKRYETTLALPIEYGTVNVVMVASGLVLYQEYKYMDTWQIAVMITGSAIVCVGIQLIHRDSLDSCKFWQRQITV